MNSNTKQTSFDAIVVGSGANGGWAAKELTEGGMRVLLLDAGDQVIEKSLPQKLIRKAKERYLNWHKSKATTQSITHLMERQPIQSKCYAWKTSPSFFVDDLDNPYTTPPDKPFLWFRGRQVGGRMLIKEHGRRLFRFSDYEFKAADRDGYGDSWCIRHADLTPYYEKVERFINIRGIPQGIPNLPNSVFSAFTPTVAERLLKSALERIDEGYQVVLGRLAPPAATVHAALKTGRLSLRSNAVVSHIVVNRNTGNAKGVAFIDRHSHKSYEVYGKVIVLCASTLESTRILLNSASPQHPAGLGNSSGVLGHYLMDHIKIGVKGTVPNPEQFVEDSLPVDGGLSGTAFIPQFRNVSDRHPDFIRGYGIQTMISGGKHPGEEGSYSMMAYGEMLPYFENRVTLNPDKKDAWGIPVLHIECAHFSNEHAMARDQLATLKHISDKIGFKVTAEDTQLYPPGMSNHEVGTARMGCDRETSVLNGFNQSWDVNNLFVTDGACFPSSGYQNPTLTMMAITTRACDYILNQAKKGNL